MNRKPGLSRQVWALFLVWVVFVTACMAAVDLLLAPGR